MRFDGRVVVLTGAAKGIGAVTAEAFAGERARVAAQSTSTAPASTASWPAWPLAAARSSG